MRNAAFALFGNLARFGRSGQARATFLEQIHSNLVSLLLHLNDPCSDVRRSCKATLRQVAPLLASEQINTMFQKHLIDDAGLHFGEFMNDLSKILVRTSIPSLTSFTQTFQTFVTPSVAFQIQDFEEKLNFYVMGSLNFFKSSWSELRGCAALFAGLSHILWFYNNFEYFNVLFFVLFFF